MVAKLSVAIELQGGKDIERQLENIGKAGQKAFADIQKAAGQAGGFDKLDPGVIEQKLAGAKLAADELAKVQKAIADTASWEKLAGALSLVDGAFNKLGLSAKLLLVTLGPLGAIATVLAAALGVALVVSAKNAAEAISAVDKEAIKLGTSVGQLDKLRIGLEGAGLAAGEISSALQSAFGVIEGQAVTQAIKETDSWGRTAGNAMVVLKKAVQGTGDAAVRAREQLAKIGEKDTVGQIIENIGKQSTDTATRIDLVVQKLLSMKEGAERTALAMLVFKEDGAAVVQALRTGSLEQYIAAQRKQIAVTAEQANTANKLGEAQNRVATSWARFSSVTLAPGLTATLNFVASTIDTIAAALATVDWASWGATAVAALNAIAAPGAALLTGLMNVANAISGTAVAAWNAFSSAATSAINAVGGAIDWVIGKITEAINTLKNFIGMGGGAGGPGPAYGPGFAGGGTVGGRGTGTSDSNLAWVSRGEHIMPARAVRQPGVLALLEALRRSGGNLSGVLDRLGHFALGGMVGPVPAFAGGGVNGMSHVTIAFPGMAPVGGLRAPGSVVEELRRAAGLAQVRSGGRKPSRYS